MAIYNKNEKPKSVSGVEIKDLDPSDTGKMCKASPDSKKTALLIDPKSYSCSPVLIASGNVEPAPAVLPGATTSSPRQTSSRSTSGSSIISKINTYHQYITNTSQLKIYMMIYFDYGEKTSKPIKGQLHDSHIMDLNCKRATVFGDSTMSATLSMHEEYEFYDLTTENKELKKCHIFDIFQMGNIVDFVVVTKIKFSDKNQSQKKEDISFEEKTFLIQRGAVSGYNVSRNGSGSSTLNLDIEPIDVYAKKVNVFISPHPQTSKVNGIVQKSIEKSNSEIVKKISSSGSSSSGKVSTQITYISNITELLIKAGTARDGSAGRNGLTAIYSYIGACFSVGNPTSPETRKYWKKPTDKETDSVLFGWKVTTEKTVQILKKALIGVVGGKSDPLLTTHNLSDVFNQIVKQLTQHDGIYSYATLLSSLGIPVFHEIYYDPFVELDKGDSTYSTYKEKSSFNQIPVYSNKEGTEFFFEEIYKPSFVHRNKPILSIFKEKIIAPTVPPNIKAFITDQNGMHLYILEQDAILNITIKATKDNIKTGIIFKDLKKIEGIEETKDVVIFGTNLLEIDVSGYMQTSEFRSSTFFKRLYTALIGKEGHYGEASITCIYSPVRAGCTVFIPFKIKDKVKGTERQLYAKGYVDSVTDNFSASGDATVTLNLIYLNYTSIALLMGLTANSIMNASIESISGLDDLESRGKTVKEEGRFSEEGF